MVVSIVLSVAPLMILLDGLLPLQVWTTRPAESHSLERTGLKICITSILLVSRCSEEENNLLFSSSHSVATKTALYLPLPPAPVSACSLFGCSCICDALHTHVFELFFYCRRNVASLDAAALDHPFCWFWLESKHQLPRIKRREFYLCFGVQRTHFGLFFWKLENLSKSLLEALSRIYIIYTYIYICLCVCAYVIVRID